MGNKSHLYEKEEVYEEEVKQYAKSINAIFTLVSTKSIVSVNNILYEIGNRYLQIKEKNKKEEKFYSKDFGNRYLTNKEKKKKEANYILEILYSTILNI